MVDLTTTAVRQFGALLDHFIARERDQAAAKLVQSLRVARQRIATEPKIGSSHPRPYPDVAHWQFRWIKVHRYWFGYSLAKGYPVITNIFHDTADIPKRVEAEDDEAPFQP